jgi:uncharacterized repeat protein (TIGR03803 family)
MIDQRSFAPTFDRRMAPPSRWSALKTAAAVLLLCAATAITSPAQVFTPLVSFTGVNGGGPYAGLIQATDGNFYGTTYYGGIYSNGVVFRITPKGNLTTLYTFCNQSGGGCDDGASPYSALVQGTDGNFYGTTSGSGANAGGTIFKITPTGKLTTLYGFCAQANCTDGKYPMGALVQATNGNFYGTTWYGGATNNGTVFEITPSGRLTTLYNFCSVSKCADGALPLGGLIQASSGNFYGTTEVGGANCSVHLGCGTVFEITPAGKLTTLHRFAGGNDGYGPQDGLAQAANGNFYGTTTDGGVSTQCADGCGTVFEMTPAGKVTILHSFCEEAGCPDGSFPAGAAVQGTNGNFYGTTSRGGPSSECNSRHFSGCGTIFEITSAGKFTTLYNFCEQAECADGSLPWAGLIQSTSGQLYGTTTGYLGYGTIYSLGVGLKPFVTTTPNFGQTGSNVVILGNNLAGSTAVSFNGTPATFTASNSAIATTVPAGATTGIVTVTTPSGTLSSNVVFHVRP